MNSAVSPSVPPSDQQRLFDLLELVVEGDASGEEFAEFEQALAADEATRALAVRFLHMHALVERFELNHSVSLSITTPLRQTQVVEKLSRSIYVTRNSVIAATLLIGALIYGAFGYLAWDLRSKNPAREIDRDDSRVAMVTDDSDVHWLSDRFSTSENSSIRVGEQLQIYSGVVELRLNRGTNVSVQGPAQWSIDGDNAVSLRQGTLIAQVPAQAVGFTVGTPTTKIVDLGTEFGVEVDATGRTDVQVLKGAVNVDYPSLDDKSKSANRSVRMTAGSAKRFSAQSENADVVTTTEIAPWLDKTSRIVKRGGPQQTLSAETKYAAAVLADRPLGYWRFSDTDSHRAMDASGHGNHGEYFGVVSTKNPGICADTSDRCVRFLGKEYRGYVQITDFELPASCTVELWAKSATPRWNSYGWLLSCRAPEGLQITPVEASRNWQAYVGNADIYFAEIGPHQGPASIDDRFHQYAFSYDAADDRGALYCDGVLVHEATKMFGDKPRHKATRLTMYVGRLAPEYYESWAEASVDELAIYEGALPAAAIQRHFEAAEITMKNGVEHPPSPVTKE